MFLCGGEAERAGLGEGGEGRQTRRDLAIEAHQERIASSWMLVPHRCGSLCSRFGKASICHYPLEGA